MAAKRRRNSSVPADDPGEISFHEADEPLRAGDRELGSEFSAARVRRAGMSGGETGRGDVTADDLAPETLLDDDGLAIPGLRGGRRAADTTLRKVGIDAIGAGRGLDEAELAEIDPVGHAPRRREQRP